MMQDQYGIFDERDDLLQRINDLLDELKNTPQELECYPKRSVPYCPPDDAPPPRVVAHPYIPGETLESAPRAKRVPVKVTVDGRLAEDFQPRDFYFEDPPLRVPPWFRPRYNSNELRGGVLYSGCHCWKKNGLQDDCPRWDCGGRPECASRPLPECPPGMDPPVEGVRKGNAFVRPLIGHRGPPPPPPPHAYPVPELVTMKITPPFPPMAPALPLPQHLQLIPECATQ